MYQENELVIKTIEHLYNTSNNNTISHFQHHIVQRLLCHSMEIFGLKCEQWAFTNLFWVHFPQSVHWQSTFFNLMQHFSRKIGKLSERMLPVPQTLFNDLTQLQQSTRHQRPVSAQCYLKQSSNDARSILQHLQSLTNHCPAFILIAVITLHTYLQFFRITLTLVSKVVH